MVKLYVEGGGDSASLRTACRQGFTTFITNAGLAKRPRIVACGSRRNAYESFCIAIEAGQDAMLLVDSEMPVIDSYQSSICPKEWLPWAHLKSRPGDGWEKPNGCGNEDCHLMTQVMESWFIADRSALQTFFGQGFKENALPAATNPIESLSKQKVYDALDKATKDCKTKSKYGKGEHSFKILCMIKPSIIIASSPWAKRFIDQLTEKMNA